MFKLAELFVTVGAQTGLLDAALRGIKNQLANLAKMPFHLPLGGLGAALGIGSAVGGLGLLIKAAGDMESKMASLSKATDLEGTELAAMKRQLMDLSTTIKGVKLDDLIDIATSGAKLGIATGDLVEYTKGIAMVSSAMDDIPAGEIADQIGKLNTVFKLGVKGTMQLGSAIDKLADSGVSSASGILNVTQRISGSAVAAKISAQEATALAAALLDTGTQGELAASALLDFIASLNQVQGRKHMAEALKMDMASFAKLVETKPIEAIQKFLGELKKMDAAKQLKTLADIGIKGDTHGAEIMKLAQQADNLGKYVGFANSEFKTLDQITKSYSASAGLAWSNLASFQNQVQILADKIGGYLLPAFTRLTTGLKEAGKAFEKFVDDNKPTLESWAKWAEDKIGVGTSALTNWRLALDVARAWLDEKADLMKQRFDWLYENITPIMDNISDSIGDGFREGMRQATEAINVAKEEIKKAFEDLFPDIKGMFVDWFKGQLGMTPGVGGIGGNTSGGGGVVNGLGIGSAIPEPDWAGRGPGEKGGGGSWGVGAFVPKVKPGLDDALRALQAANDADDEARKRADAMEAYSKAQDDAAKATPGLMNGPQKFKGFNPGQNAGDAGKVAAALDRAKESARTEADARSRAVMNVPPGIGEKIGSAQLKEQQTTNQKLDTLIKKMGGGGSAVPRFQ
jgi:TP901 family phage tail tape measure protein